MHNTEAQTLMKLQRYSIATDNISLVQEQNNLYLVCMFYTARSVTNVRALFATTAALTPISCFPWVT